jgi:hypothetical protein
VRQDRGKRAFKSAFVLPVGYPFEAFPRGQDPHRTFLAVRLYLSARSPTPSHQRTNGGADHRLKAQCGEPALAYELTDRPTDLHRLMHRIAQHLVDGKDREPRSLAGVETRRPRDGLKHDDTQARAAEPLDRVPIEEPMRASDFDIERAFVLKASRGTDNGTTCINNVVEHDDAAPFHRFANHIERTRRCLLALLVHDRNLVSGAHRVADATSILGGAEIGRGDHSIRKSIAALQPEMPDVIDIARHVFARSASRAEHKIRA